MKSRHHSELKRSCGSGCSGGVCASNNEGLGDVCLDKSPQKGRPDGSLIFMIFPVGVSGIWSISLIMCHLATHDGRCFVLSPFSWHWLMLYIGTFCLFEGYGCLKDAETLWRTDCDLWKPWDSLSHFPSQKVRSNWSNGNQTFVAFSLDSHVHLGKLSQRSKRTCRMAADHPGWTPEISTRLFHPQSSQSCCQGEVA